MKKILIENTPRRKLLNFRLSGEETELLIQSARDSGARSVSEYVRSAVLAHAKRDAHIHSERNVSRIRGSAPPVSGDVDAKVQQALTALEDAIRATRREISNG